MKSLQNEVRIRLATEDDLQAILSLQQKNLGCNLSEKEKLEQGFVSLETSLELLREIRDRVGIIVGEVGDQIIGYIFPITLELAQKIPLLFEFLKRLTNLKYKNKPLTLYRLIIIGQVSIDKPYRGKGVFERLYQEFRKQFAHQYDIAITEVSTNNPRSLNAHIHKARLKNIDRYSAENRDWYILALDLQSP